MDKLESKQFRYQKLIAEAQQSYPRFSENSVHEGIQLFRCDACKKEINLWTYWQGHNNLDAKIMLVGQDWGSAFDDRTQMTIKQIELANEGKLYQYMEGNQSITDDHLVKLFRVLNYPDITKPNPDLFFTNFVLGYRNKGFSGKFDKQWITHDRPFFYELVQIIEPNVILCLGRVTFEAVISSFQKTKSIRINNYNSFIESEDNPVKIVLDSGKLVHVFALAHCGALGTMNRNRRKGQLTDKLQIQKEDWKRVLPYLEQNESNT